MSRFKDGEIMSHFALIRGQQILKTKAQEFAQEKIGPIAAKYGEETSFQLKGRYKKALVKD